MSSAASLALPKARLLGWQLVYEHRSFWRNRSRGAFSFLLPIALLVALAAANKGKHVSTGVAYATFFIPGIMAYGLITSTFGNLAVSLSIQRDQGVLKRVRGTPLSPVTFVTGRVVASVLVMLELLVVMALVGWAFYGVHTRVETLPGLVLSVVAGGACFTALAFAVTGFIPNADAAPAITAGIILPLSFFSNIWFPVNSTGWVNTIGNIFPVKHLADGFQLAYNPSTVAPGISGAALFSLGIWFLVGLFVTFRRFRWESGKV